MSGDVGLSARGMGDLRRMMVDGQVRTFDVTDQRVLDAFYRVPRETSLPASLAPLAYSDAPLILPAGASGRTQMQPMFLAKLLQGATLEPDQAVLVVAGASGYPAALLAHLVGRVVSLDDDASLSAAATAYLGSLGLLSTVEVVTGPLAAGHKAGAPYHCIVVNGGVETALDDLFAQLAPGGCLVAMEAGRGLGSSRAGKAVRYDRIGSDISERTLFDATVPVLDAFRQPAGFVF